MRRVCTALLISATLIATAGCSAVQNDRGYVPEPGALDNIVVGKDTRATISQKLGDPTAKSTFDNNTWYYISSHDVQAAFFAPRSTSRSIVAIQFAQNGQVSGVKHYGLKDGRVVDYIGRQTPVNGRNLTLLQEIFNAIPGNIGGQQPQTGTNPGPVGPNGPTDGGGGGPLGP